MEFVKHCYDRQMRTFVYTPGYPRGSRAMAATGILSLSLGGLQGTEMARAASDWVIANPFCKYNDPDEVGGPCYHYSVFYCSQAMFQYGGRHWAQYYPRIVRMLVANQHQDGSWAPEIGGHARYGNVYSSALAVLALTAPYQLLPIFQR